MCFSRSIGTHTVFIASYFEAKFPSLYLLLGGLCCSLVLVCACDVRCVCDCDDHVMSQRDVCSSVQSLVCVASFVRL